MQILGKEINVEKLSKSEKRIADYLSKHLDRLMYMNTNELAEALDISAATVSRFWKEIGFNNFIDFKQTLKARIEVDSPVLKMKDILSRVDSSQVYSDLIELVTLNMQHTRERLDRANWQRALDLLHSGEIIYTHAVAAAKACSDLLSFRLNRFAYNCVEIAPNGDAILESLINIRPKDLVVLFSFSHVRAEQRVIADYCQSEGIPLLIITDLFTSELIPSAEVVLCVERGEIWEFHSMVPPLLLVESLVVGIAMMDQERAVEQLESLAALRMKYKDDLAH